MIIRFLLALTEPGKQGRPGGGASETGGRGGGIPRVDQSLLKLTAIRGWGKGVGGGWRERLIIYSNVLFISYLAGARTIFTIMPVPDDLAHRCMVCGNVPTTTTQTCNTELNVPTTTTQSRDTELNVPTMTAQSCNTELKKSTTTPCMRLCKAPGHVVCPERRNRCRDLRRFFFF